MVKDFRKEQRKDRKRKEEKKKKRKKKKERNKKNGKEKTKKKEVKRVRKVIEKKKKDIKHKKRKKASGGKNRCPSYHKDIISHPDYLDVSDPDTADIALDAVQCILGGVRHGLADDDDDVVTKIGCSVLERQCDGDCILQ